MFTAVMLYFALFAMIHFSAASVPAVLFSRSAMIFAPGAMPE